MTKKAGLLLSILHFYLLLLHLLGGSIGMLVISGPILILVNYNELDGKLRCYNKTCLFLPDRFHSITFFVVLHNNKIIHRANTQSQGYLPFAWLSSVPRRFYLVPRQA
jgi:hypothetical protein